LFKNGHEDDVEEEKKRKSKDFQENYLLRGIIHLNLDNWIRFILIKVEIHTLSNDLRRHL
jgi:hypothetical protein